MDFLLGTLAMVTALVALGITRGRWLPTRRWVFAWVSLSATLVSVVVASTAFLGATPEFVVGLALGYIVAVTAHASHHAVEQMRTVDATDS